jgi:hypothetical protein
MVPLFGTFAQTLPANALVGDVSAVRNFREKRNILRAEENSLLIDFDELRKQIDDLNRRNDPSFDRQLDDLHRRLNETYANLQRIRMDLRDVELKMM